MFWTERVIKGVDGEQIINDSKTPSGRVHVGALRGVVIHDAVFRTLREHHVPARYLFGVDDYDPVDEIPAGEDEHFRPYLGAPLCNVPAPRGSSATDMAEHYIGEFFEIFRELGVETESYRMRDIYRSGRFNEAIDRILRQAPAVREIYLEVSGSKRPESWFPFQAICESCGRVGTTEVSAYEGGEVVYTCRSDLVTWATGCGHRGKVSPFDGRGKLPWKLEWTAKWAVFGITLEGAGKDHNTKGGSRDVATHCLRRIFDRHPPRNIPYEFFLVGGAKMSSSRGVGAAAREIADLLPPEVLRFLMIRTQPNQPVNFAPDEKYITKLFNDFDRTHHRSFHDPAISEDEKQIYRLAEVCPEGDFFAPAFSLVLALLQLPHLRDLEEEVALRKGAPLTETERRHLERRIRSARVWLERYASEDEKIALQETLPAAAEELDATQRAFLHLLAEALGSADWTDEGLQTTVFDSARLTPIEQPRAFQAIYRTLLARDAGPKAGNLLAFLDRELVIRRFRELPFDAAKLWDEAAIDADSFQSWPVKQGETRSVDAREVDSGVEATITFADGKTHLRRIRTEDPRALVESLR